MTWGQGGDKRDRGRWWEGEVVGSRCALLFYVVQVGDQEGKRERIGEREGREGKKNKGKIGLVHARKKKKIRKSGSTSGF